MRFLSILALCLVIFSITCPALFASEPAYGPVIDLPGNSNAADPSVIRVDDTYYIYSTTTGVSIETWSSTDLETWTYEGVVWGPAEPGSWNTVNVWAPDVFPYEDRFYLYYTADLRIGVAVSDAPTGPFIDAYDHPFIGYGYGGASTGAIDAHVFLDDDGKLYLYCTGYFPFAVLRVFPMTDPLHVTEQWIQLFGPGLINWEGFVNEGPWMIKRDGVYYLMYSGNGANLPLYGVGYATASDPLGPFTKAVENPILRSDWDVEFYGPGHNSAVAGPDGNLWMFYHTKVYPTVSWDRRIRKNRLDFDDAGRLYVVLDDDTADDTNDDSSPDDTSDEPSDDSADDTASPSSGDDDYEDNNACCGC